MRWGLFENSRRSRHIWGTFLTERAMYYYSRQNIGLNLGWFGSFIGSFPKQIWSQCPGSFLRCRFGASFFYLGTSFFSWIKKSINDQVKVSIWRMKETPTPGCGRFCPTPSHSLSSTVTFYALEQFKFVCCQNNPKICCYNKLKTCCYKQTKDLLL
jgi:hypothetical protein